MFLARRVCKRHTPFARCLRYYTPAHGSARLVENDSVLLQPGKGHGAPTPVFVEKLQAGSRIMTLRGNIEHTDIIGRHLGDEVLTKLTKSTKAPFPYILHKATLDQYVTSSRRLVTPLYPHDAKLIVELLDLHPDTFDSGISASDERLEILEAGTGHGALTLYLSRAIHAANSAYPRQAQTDGEQISDEAVASWKARRAAVLHSVEVHKAHSIHAEKVVQGFRHGIYHRNVDFHIGDVSEWCRNRTSERSDNDGFLSRAFLDLPAAEDHLAAVSEALRVDGTLIVFNPSITQILDCFKRVKDERLPLWLENVVELGNNGGSGGREWAVKPVRPRAASKVDPETATAGLDGTDVDANDAAAVPEGSQDTDAITDAKSQKSGDWKLICRPKVGTRIVGGGFLGVFRKRQPPKSNL